MFNIIMLTATLAASAMAAPLSTSHKVGSTHIDANVRDCLLVPNCEVFAGPGNQTWIRHKEGMGAGSDWMKNHLNKTNALGKRDTINGPTYFNVGMLTQKIHFGSINPIDAINAAQTGGGCTAAGCNGQYSFNTDSPTIVQYTAMPGHLTTTTTASFPDADLGQAFFDFATTMFQGTDTGGNPAITVENDDYYDFYSGTEQTSTQYSAPSGMNVGLWTGVPGAPTGNLGSFQIGFDYVDTGMLSCDDIKAILGSGIGLIPVVGSAANGVFQAAGDSACGDA